MTSLLERVRGLRQRTERLRDSTGDSKVRRTAAGNASLLLEVEAELERLQMQENWALHMENEVCELKERLKVLA